MKRMLTRILILGLLVTSSASFGFAEGEIGEGYETIQGKVICLGCTLKSEKGAKAQCSLYGHTNAIRTVDGKIWSILENDQSTDLVKNHDYAGKDVEISGKKFVDAQTIEVGSFKALSE